MNAPHVRPLFAVFLLFALLATVCGAEPARTTYGSAPWKIHQTATAQYPARLTSNGVTHGEACVRISIDTKGELLDALVITRTHRDFGDEALRTVKRWRYEPEWIEGQPIGIVADIVFEFRVNGPVAVDKRTPAPNDGPYAPIDPFARKVESLKRVDRIPTPVHIVAPIYPAEWSDRDISGVAQVDFYIDETGRARVPVVIATDHHLLGAAAATAVAQWQFEPPTLDGKPVMMHAQQIFSFQPEKKK